MSKDGLEKGLENGEEIWWYEIIFIILPPLSGKGKFFN